MISLPFHNSSFCIWEWIIAFWSFKYLVLGISSWVLFKTTYNHNLEVTWPSKSIVIYVMLLTSILLSDISAFWSRHENVSISGSCNFIDILASILLEYKHPLSTSVCIYVISFFRAFTRNGEVFKSILFFLAVSCSWIRLSLGISSFPK